MAPTRSCCCCNCTAADDFCVTDSSSAPGTCGLASCSVRSRPLVWRCQQSVPFGCHDWKRSWSPRMVKVLLAWGLSFLGQQHRLPLVLPSPICTAGPILNLTASASLLRPTAKATARKPKLSLVAARHPRLTSTRKKEKGFRIHRAARYAVTNNHVGLHCWSSVNKLGRRGRLDAQRVSGMFVDC